MKKTAITVTEAARNFADCINRVHFQSRIFVLVKNGKALARIVPETEKICTGHDLAEALAHVELSTSEAIAWSKENVQARKALKQPRDKWQ